ncbi:uncharacterized protein LOC116293750 [Actinia tenebrosa]|uniref:Uncharacterized protein LOC116293750 n=1 Tax=Actinia tenebrosa TaxID=6105 RepID=A0A6P8HWN3_ACTTE|nr:uncharacterized protein LOC116293750 [Actinia tenebrosa]
MDPGFSWEPEEFQVPKEDIEKLITSLLVAEEQQWLQSASPLQQISSSQIIGSSSCCNSPLSRDGEPSCGRCDPGFKLLRHGNSICQIHSYFQNLEPRRYCLSLTARNKALDGPSNRMRLVRGDSRIDQKPPRDEGVRNVSQREATLNPKESELYEKVILCCQIPVLSAPPVPSPYSPSPSIGAVSPNSPRSPQFEFYDSSYSPPARDYVFSPFRPSQRFSFNVEEVSSDEPVQAEQLQELARRTFGLTKRQQISLEKSIREKMKPKTADRVLVEDLLTQLSLLHKNFHPYYRIQSFLDKNGYDQWVETEKDHINRLVKRFWNSPLPSLNECYPIHLFDAHEGYNILLSKLIREESLNKCSSHSVFGDAIPTSPLSPASCRLLKEFGLRYGVGELYRRLIYLQYLVNHFECEVWYIKHVTNLLEIVMGLVTNTPEIYVKEEFLMCIEILSLLFRLSKYYLTRVTRLFKQNSPPGGVTSLVAMAAMVEEAAHFLKSTFPAVFMNVREARKFVDSFGEEPFEIQLASYLKEEITGRYERFKVIAIDELQLNRYENPLSPQLLNILILNIRDEIIIYKTYYQEEFQRYLDFVQLATVTFYRLLMDDVGEMCQLIPINAPTNEVDLRMLSLAFRLSILDKDNVKYLRLGMQTWREPFLRLSLLWMDVVGRYLKDLVPCLLQRDQWHVTSVVQEESVSRPASAVRRMPRTQCITRSDHSAFTPVDPVHCAAESDFREQKKKIEGVSASNPHPSSSTAQISSSDVSSSSSSESLSSWQPVRMNASPPVTTTFKGKTIVTQAQVHIPDVAEDDNVMTTSSDSNKTEDIETMTFEEGKVNGESPLEHSQRIENIDEDDNKVVQNTTECNHQRELEISEQDILNSAGKTTKQNSNEVVESVLTGFTGQKPVSLEGEQRATPYENDDSTTALGSTDDSYTTAESSFSEGSEPVVKDEGEIGEDDRLSIESTTSVSGESMSTEMSAEKLTDSVADTLDNSLEDDTKMSVEGAQISTASDTTMQSVEGAQMPGTLDTQDTLANAVTNVSVSGQNIKRTVTPTAQKNEASDLNCKTSCREGPHKTVAMPTCQECPHKTVAMPTDIEHIADPPTTTRAMNHCESDNRLDQASTERRPVPIASSQSLPVPKHKLLERTLEAEKASLSSVPTEYGSCPTSYTTARDSSRSTDDVSTDNDSYLSTDYESLTDSEPSTTEPPPAPLATTDASKTEIVPVSSSMVDLLCCIQRLTSFACHLCKVLCPTERVSPGSDGQVEMEENRATTMEIKTAICGKLIKITKRIVTLYVDDILAIETCGMSEDDMVSVIGQNITRHLIGRYRSGEVIGCRFNPGRRERCNMRNYAGNKVQPCPALCKVKDSYTGCELTSEKMGLRISDVIILQSLLSWLHDRITTAISRFDSVPVFHGISGEFDRQSILSESYCQNGPTLDGSSQGFQQHSLGNGEEDYLRLAQSLDVSLDECSADLEGNLNAQDKLLAYRLNEIFKKILHELLNLSLPSFSIRRRLQPAIDFLRRRLTAIHRVMLRDRFMVLIRRLLRHVVQDFEEEVEQLKERRPGASEHAGLLMMSLAHLMQLFHNQKQGLSSEELNIATETVSKHIELYTSSTIRLIRLYQWLRQQMVSLEREQIGDGDDFTSSVSTYSHHSSSQSPADNLIEALRSELHATSKCFSGAAFVEWVQNYVQKNGYDSLGVCIGMTETDTGIELGQYLLERNQLVCVRNAEPTTLINAEEQADREADTEQPASSLVQQRMSRSSRGAVVMDATTLPSRMTVNKITVQQHNSSGSRPNSSQSTSQRSTETSSMSDPLDEPDTQGLLDSVDVILRQSRSNQSLALLFYNSPNVFYSFISDDEGSGGELKYKLAFLDRFLVGVKLQHIVCALYTRRKHDETARFFLKRLPINEVAYALGYKETPICFNI